MIWGSFPPFRGRLSPTKKVVIQPMAEFSIITPTNAELNLSDNPYFWLTNVENQTFFDSTNYAFVGSNTDGNTINYISINPRQITFAVIIKNNVDVEDAKRYIFQNLKPKQKHTIKWTRNGKVLTIAGIFESASLPRWSNQVTGQLTFLCEQPFWVDAESTSKIISDTIATHYFTDCPNDMLYFADDSGIVMGVLDSTQVDTYYNDGDVQTPLYMEIHATGTVVNPIVYVNTTDNYIGLTDTLTEGDIVTITSQQGYKDVRKNGTSALDKITQGSTFVNLELGQNSIRLAANQGASNAYLIVRYRNQYI